MSTDFDFGSTNPTTEELANMPPAKKQLTEADKVKLAAKKRANLVKYASRKTQNILKSLRVLSTYYRFSPTAADKEKVFGEIKKAVESAHDAWGGKKQEETGFAL